MPDPEPIRSKGGHLVPPFSEWFTRTQLHGGRILAPGEEPGDMVDRVLGEIARIERERFPGDAATANSFMDRLEQHLARMNATFAINIWSGIGRRDTDPALARGRTGSSCAVLPLDSTRPFAHLKAVIDSYVRLNMGFGIDFTEVAEGQAVARAREIIDYARELSQKGNQERRIALMLSIHIGHPDAIEFARMKHDYGDMDLCNVSLRTPDAYMQALEHGRPYHCDLGGGVREIDPLPVWIAAIESAASCGDPGLLFDSIEADNAVPLLGSFLSTSPCAEAPQRPLQTCTFASLNAAQCLRPATDGGHEVDVELVVDIA